MTQLTPVSPGPAPAEGLRFRAPTVDDGAAMHALVKTGGVLEPNTCYAYLLLCTHFADTTLVASRDDELVGFVAAYRLPSQPSTVFVWQIGVHEGARGEGLASRLLDALVETPGCAGVTHLEATVGVSNAPSQRLFSSFARRQGAPLSRKRGFVAADFGPLSHEEEELFRIGPLRRRS